MKRYYVSVTETLNRVVSVCAESEEDAEEKVINAYKDCDIVLDDGDFVGYEVEAEDDQESFVDYEKKYGETYQRLDEEEDEED